MTLVAGTRELATDPILVHDYLLVMRGGERTFATLCDLWPGARVGALLYDAAVFSERLSGHPIRTSLLQRLRLNQTTFKAAMPLMPAAMRTLDVSGHRLVVSSSSAFAHGVDVDPGATHVCYCHTPFRYAWYEREAAVAQAPAAVRPLIAASLAAIRRWDYAKAQRPTHYVANGRICQERIARYWGREAPIVHPPVELDRFAPGVPEDFVLLVGELVRHKQWELALGAAGRAGVPVKVVGGGSDEARLRALHGERAEFLGRVSDAELAALYARARALVVPNAEEFGITAVEAQAAGRPVIAARAGGVLETVIEGVTGAFFEPGDADSLTAILSDPALDGFRPEDAVANAGRFSVEAFQQGMLEQIERALAAEVAES
jgi:glycosyltransferase involved in cell wall biosynthesis